MELEKNITCLICKNINLVKNVAVVTNVWKSSHDITFCESCKGYFLDQMPSQEEYESIYKNSYYDEKFKIADLIKPLFRRARCISQFEYIKKRAQLNVNGKSAIEIGAGDGMLLSLFKNEGALTKGVEFSDHYRDYCKKKYDILLQSLDYFEIHGQFDILMMSHVLEHFCDVQKVMKKAHELLKPGGYFFIEIPNSPLSSNVPGEFLSQFLNTIHTFNFTPTSITKLVNQHPFEIINIERFTYRLSANLNRAQSDKISQALLEGSGLSYWMLPEIARYILMISLRPNSSYRPIIDLESTCTGMGDNIRLILKAK